MPAFDHTCWKHSEPGRTALQDNRKLYPQLSLTVACADGIGRGYRPTGAPTHHHTTSVGRCSRRTRATGSADSCVKYRQVQRDLRRKRDTHTTSSEERRGRGGGDRCNPLILATFFCILCPRGHTNPRQPNTKLTMRFDEPCAHLPLPRRTTRRGRFVHVHDWPAVPSAKKKRRFGVPLAWRRLG